MVGWPFMTVHLCFKHSRAEVAWIQWPPIPLRDACCPAGTVLDTMAHHWQAWKQLSEEFGFSLSVDQLLSLAGKPSRAIMELLCEEQASGAAARQSVKQRHRHASRGGGGAPPFLA